MNKEIYFDASALRSAFCWRLFWLNIAGGYGDLKPDLSLVYGSAFHKFTETYAKTGSQEESLKDALNYFKSVPDAVPRNPKYSFLTWGHLVSTCATWLQSLEHDKFKIMVHDNKPIVEEKFKIPVGESFSVGEDTYQIFLCGTIDKVGQFLGGCYALGDYKTTCAWNSTEYLSGYKLDPQLITYAYALRWFADKYPDSVWHTVAASGNVGGFIDGVFLSKDKPAEIKRSNIIIFKDSDLDEYGALIHRVAARIKDTLIAGVEMPPREGKVFGGCKIIYGHCKYYGVCSSPDDISAQAMLRNHFKQSNYNPLMFR